MPAAAAAAHYGAGGAVAVATSADAAAAAVAATEATIVYKYGRGLKEGEQIHLNYGPRGNEELLGYFGFTLPHNRADVVTINAISTGATTTPLVQPPGWRAVLWYDSIPAKLLDACRRAAAAPTDHAGLGAGADRS